MADEPEAVVLDFVGPLRPARAPPRDGSGEKRSAAVGRTFLQIGCKYLIFGRVVFGRFTAKHLIGREFAWTCEPR